MSGGFVSTRRTKIGQKKTQEGHRGQEKDGLQYNQETGSNRDAIRRKAACEVSNHFSHQRFHGCHVYDFKGIQLRFAICVQVRPNLFPNPRHHNSRHRGPLMPTQYHRMLPLFSQLALWKCH